jgi:ABC-2 type transport system permease protein
MDHRTPKAGELAAQRVSVDQGSATPLRDTEANLRTAHHRGEFRHGTITPSLLVEPVRTWLMAAKLLAQLIAGLVLGLLCYGVCAGIVAGILSSRGIATGMSTSDWIGAIIGGAVATMLYATLGLGVGALLRNQVGAIVVLLAWVFVIENLLGIIPGGFGDGIKKYGLSGVGHSLARTASDASRIGQVPAGLLLLGYTVVLFIAGTMVVRQRDVSS